MRNKLIAVFAVLIIPLSISQAFVIEQAAAEMETQLINTAAEGHIVKCRQVNELLDSIESVASLYRSDSVFLYMMGRQYSAPIDSIDLYEQVWSRSRMILSVYPGIFNIRLYTENPYLVENPPFVHKAGNYFVNTQAYEQLMGGALRHWGAVRSVARGAAYWDAGAAPGARVQNRVIAYTAPMVRSGVNGPFSIFLTVEYNAGKLDPILSGDAHTVCGVLGADGSPIEDGSAISRFEYLFGNGADTLSAEQAMLDGDEYLVWLTPLNNGWKLASAASTRQITEKATDMRSLGAIFTLVFAAAYITVVFIASSRLLLRSRRLASRMAAFDAERWEPYEPVKGNDEINAIDRAFLSMGHKLSESIKLNYIQEIEKKQAELSRLHTQIRPHFLYNMLSTIAWAVEDHPRPVARQAIENLAAFYRFSLAKGREIIPLREELRILDAYMDLQRLRFRGLYTFAQQVDPVFSDIPIPRMTLQALAENSLIHGPGDDRGAGKALSIILTAAVLDGKVVLTLADDGVGIGAEMLEKLRSGGAGGESGSGLGYRTVNERIRLYFGPGYGVDIESAPGAGTTAYVRLPLPDAADDEE